MKIEIAMIAATILGTMFPAYLVKGVRSKDSDVSETATIKCCIIFGALVFVSIMILRS